MSDNGWEGTTITIPGGTVTVETKVDVETDDPEPTERIDSDERGVDDVAIGPVEMFRAERMDKGYWWTAVYLPDGSRHVFAFHSKSRITVRHHKEPPLPPKEPT